LVTPAKLRRARLKGGHRHAIPAGTFRVVEALIGEVEKFVEAHGALEAHPAHARRKRLVAGSLGPEFRGADSATNALSNAARFDY
jgi:hypothetical protein